MTDLREAVRTRFLPIISDGGAAIVESGEGDSFDNAYVTVDLSTFRVRITRERRQILPGFAGLAEANTWFDWSLVLEYLGLATDDPYPDDSEDVTLTGLANFINTFRDELSAMFAPGSFPRTRQALKALGIQRAKRTLGWDPAGG
jgi:hypothetical protein